MPEGNVAELLASAARRSPDAIAVRHEGSAFTYAQLSAGAGQVQAAVSDAGVAVGDRVLLIGGTTPLWVSTYFGLLSAGMVVVTVNPMATRTEIEYFLSDSGAALALGFGEVSDRARAAAAAVGSQYRSLDAPRELPAVSPVEPEACRIRPVERAVDDLAVLLYTSGTTGRPKGAMLTHGNLRSAAATFTEEFRLSPDDCVFVCLPVSHVFGQACILNPALMAGATVTLQTRFQAVEALELIVHDRITVFAGVPTMYNALLGVPTAIRQRLGESLRLAISGGGPIPVETLRRFEDRFGCPILEGYGMTESTGAATFNRLSRPRKPGRVGTPFPGTSIRVVDADGNDVGSDTVGEVLISGPTVMGGYWDRPEATAEALSGGWLHTGDLGARDGDGDLAIIDRKKDMIIRGGYNVYPREVEEVLVQHPDVVEALVVGVADEHFGEEVGAAVVARPGSRLDTDAIRAWVEPRLSPYKRPRVIRFLDELPRTSNDKLARRGLDLSGETRERAVT